MRCSDGSGHARQPGGSERAPEEPPAPDDAPDDAPAAAAAAAPAPAPGALCPSAEHRRRPSRSAAVPASMGRPPGVSASTFRDMATVFCAYAVRSHEARSVEHLRSPDASRSGRKGQRAANQARWLTSSKPRSSSTLATPCSASCSAASARRSSKRRPFQIRTCEGRAARHAQLRAPRWSGTSHAVTGLHPVGRRGGRPMRCQGRARPQRSQAGE